MFFGQPKPVKPQPELSGFGFQLLQPTATNPLAGQPEPVKPKFSAFGLQLQPTATNPLAGQPHPITASSEEQIEESVEESKAIITALKKIETISHDWRKQLTNLGISEDLKSEKQYNKYVKIYTDIIEEYIEKQIHKNLGKIAKET